MKKKLVISFSGGRTSAYMLWWVLNIWEDRHNWEIVVVFANTSKEVEGTYEFVRRCEIEFKIKIIWVEGEPVKSEERITKKGKKVGGKWWGVKANIVNFDTAKRKGEVFEAFIEKLGIPTTNIPWCSDQMKKMTIKALLRQIGWKKYYTAIGIRYDEPTRIRKDAKKKRILYLLNDFTVMSKWDILYWWKKEMSFDLGIEEGDGNCDNCWKKGIKIQVKNMRRRPNSFDWWQKMTDKHGHINPRNTKLKPPFNFYRGNLSPKDIKKISLLPDSEINKYSKGEINNCSESCEAF